MAKKDIIETVAKGLAESARNINEINKKNMAAIRTDAKVNFEAATTPDPGFEKVMKAEGLGNKVKAIAENIKDGAKANTVKEKERRAEIQSHGSYQTLLDEQRVKRQATIKGSTN